MECTLVENYNRCLQTTSMIRTHWITFRDAFPADRKVLDSIGFQV